MTDSASPPHPGSRPPDFEFPFAEARVAIDELEHAAGQLRSLVDEHRGAADHARVDFAGRTRERFDALFAQHIADVEADVTAFQAQADALRDLVRQAHARQHAAEQAVMRWQGAMNLYSMAASRGR
ncbi:MAG: hypothetical protein ACRD0K_06880 [Egibacteraceae bacterium]